MLRYDTPNTTHIILYAFLINTHERDTIVIDIQHHIETYNLL